MLSVISMEEIKNHFRYLVGGYYGVSLMDEYPLKEYVLRDIEDVIYAFQKTNPDVSFSYEEEKINVKEKVSSRVKLQDALLVLKEIEGPMDLVFMIQRRLKADKK